MNSQTTQLTSPTQRRLVGLVSLVQGLLIFVPTIVLGQEIGWPATLGDPASIALPRLLEQASAVQLGYFAYLVMSVLFFVTVFMISRLTLTRLAASLLPVVVGFAIASTVRDELCSGDYDLRARGQNLVTDHFRSGDPLPQLFEDQRS